MCWSTTSCCKACNRSLAGQTLLASLSRLHKADIQHCAQQSSSGAYAAPRVQLRGTLISGSAMHQQMWMRPHTLVCIHHVTWVNLTIPLVMIATRAPWCKLPAAFLAIDGLLLWRITKVWSIQMLRRPVSHSCPAGFLLYKHAVFQCAMIQSPQDASMNNYRWWLLHLDANFQQHFWWLTACCSIGYDSYRRKSYRYRDGMSQTAVLQAFCHTGMLSLNVQWYNSTGCIYE